MSECRTAVECYGLPEKEQFISVYPIRQTPMSGWEVTGRRIFGRPIVI